MVKRRQFFRWMRVMAFSGVGGIDFKAKKSWVVEEEEYVEGLEQI